MVKPLVQVLTPLLYCKVRESVGGRMVPSVKTPATEAVPEVRRLPVSA